MPSRKFLTMLVIGALSVLFFAASALAAAPLPKQAPTETETVIWQLRQAQVVNPGQTMNAKEGTFTSGFTIQALAKSKTKLVPQGTFELTFTAFSPKKDMPGQKAGIWYLQGEWRLANEKVFRNPNRARHVPEQVKGYFQAELDFNPATDPGKFTALAIVPMSPTAGRWGKGEGTVTFNKNYNGELFLELERWPGQK